MKLAEYRLKMYEQWTPKDWWKVLNSTLYLDAAFEIEKARYKLGLTQKELALRLNTKQPAIARLERGNMNLSLKYLRRIANVMGYVIRLRLVPLKQAIREEIDEVRAHIQEYVSTSFLSIDFSSKETATFTISIVFEFSPPKIYRGLLIQTQ